MAATPNTQGVPLAQLPLSYLDNLRAQLEEEIKVLTDSLAQLKMAQTKFLESKESLTKLVSENAGKDILVPLTSSLYVPGSLDNVKTVLIDIGTGYYVRKNIKEADAYFKRKVDFLTKQMENVQPALLEKHAMKQAILETMQQKIQAAHSGGEGSAVKAS